MLLQIALVIIILTGIYLLFNSYIKESGISVIILLFLGILGFAIYILIGIHIISKLESTVLCVIYWIAYTILVITVVNIFLLGYFWAVIRKKTGPYGVRGPVGDIGLGGDKGSCSIDSNQSFAIQRITSQLDKLFKDRKQDTNTTMLKDSLEPINDYLNDKINNMISSNQYKTTIDYMTTQNIPIEGFYTYLSNIWSIWFDLLYKSTSNGGDWFLDQYADENYEFSSETNPFDEIRKYDIFYWGMIEGFRRLQVEVCSENIEKPVDYKEPRLKIIVSNDYKWHWNDQHSRSDNDVTTWMLNSVTKNGEEYYPIGVVGNNDWGYHYDAKGSTSVDGLEFNADYPNGPARSSILVAGDVKSPVDYQHISYVGGNNRGWIWRPVAPEGYTCLGDLWGYWYGAESTEVPPQIKNTIKCLPTNCLEEVSYYAPELNPNSEYGIWNQRDDYDHSMITNQNASRSMEDNAYHIAIAGRSSIKPFYKIKDSCLAPPDTTIEKKELEDEYSNKAIGWNGTPSKSGEKYSIFSLLGLMPEGIITNIQNGHRYYVIHYGGVEVNRYLILLPNYDTKKWENAIEVSPDSASSNAQSSNLVRNKIYQQWIMKRESNTNKIYFVSNFNGRNLAINLDSNNGSDIYSTTTSLDNKNRFNFVSSYGETSIV